MQSLLRIYDVVKNRDRNKRYQYTLSGFINSINSCFPLICIKITRIFLVWRYGSQSQQERVWNLGLEAICLRIFLYFPNISICMSRENLKIGHDRILLNSYLIIISDNFQFIQAYVVNGQGTALFRINYVCNHCFADKMFTVPQPSNGSLHATI